MTALWQGSNGADGEQKETAGFSGQATGAAVAAGHAASYSQQAPFKPVAIRPQMFAAPPMVVQQVQQVQPQQLIQVAHVPQVQVGRCVSAPPPARLVLSLPSGALPGNPMSGAQIMLPAELNEHMTGQLVCTLPWQLLFLASLWASVHV